MGAGRFGKGGPIVPVRAIAAYLAGNREHALELVSWQHRKPKIVGESEPLTRRLKFSGLEKSLAGRFSGTVPFAVETRKTKYTTAGLHYFVNRDLGLGGEPNIIFNILGELSAAVLRFEFNAQAGYHAAGLQLVLEANVAGINNLFKPEYRAKNPFASTLAYVMRTNGTLVVIDVDAEKRVEIISGRNGLLGL